MRVFCHVATMRYRFGEFLLDAETLQIRRSDTPLQVPRRVFDLILHLLRHRQAAVSRNVLIQHLWGRDNVSYHQLAQVVLAARQLLGDNGEAQKLIRTISGFGYHWVAQVEHLQAEPASAAPAVLPADPTRPEAAGKPSVEETPDAGSLLPDFRLRPAWLWAAGVVAVSLLLANFAWQAGMDTHTDIRTHSLPRVDRSDSSVDPVAELRTQLQQGAFEAVREGLARLPIELADTPAAHLLGIELDLVRGRWQGAEAKMNLARKRILASDDPVSYAALLFHQVELLRRTRSSPAEGLAPAREALSVLLALPTSSPAPDLVLAQAHRTYGRMLGMTGALPEALTELLRARDLYQRAGAINAMVDVESAMARMWMMQGRLSDALQQLRRNQQHYAKASAPISQIYALNTMTRIQIEQLRWNEALVSSDQAMSVLQQIPETERKGRTHELRARVLIGLGRMREAASLLEGLPTEHVELPQMTAVLLALAVGDVERAHTLAMDCFRHNDKVQQGDILFEHREGALALWFEAVDRLRTTGHPPATPDPDQLAVLENPESTTGLIARGRWRAQQADLSGALEAYQQAWQRATRANHHLQARMVAQAWIDTLLQQPAGSQSALRVVDELWALDPDAMDADYSAVLLKLRLSVASGDLHAAQLCEARLAAVAGERPRYSILELQRLAAQ